MTDSFNLIGGGLVAFLMIVLIVAIASYVLSAIALMTMGKRAGIEESWLAWIPVGNFYVIGKIIKSIDFGGKKYEPAEYIFPGAFVVAMLLGRISLIGGLANMAMSLLSYYCFYLLFKKYVPEKATKYIVISIILPAIGLSVLLFKIKDLEPVQ